MITRAVAAQETGDRILDAAIEAFLERPTDQVSLIEVARRAGVAKQTVLRHFESKDRLMEAAVTRSMERARAERDGTAPGDVASAVRALVAHYERTGDGVLRLLADEGRSSALRQIADRGRAVHVDWCERTFAPALEGLRGARRERRLAQLIAICDVYTWKLLRHDRGLSRRQTETALRELLEASIGDSP